MLTSRRAITFSRTQLSVFSPQIAAHFFVHATSDNSDMTDAAAVFDALSKMRIPRRCLVPELIGRLQDDEGRAGNQVLRLEQPIDRGLREQSNLVARPFAGLRSISTC